DMEQGVLRTGERGAVEGDAEGAGGVVRLPGEALGLVEIRARLDRGAGDLEHRQVAGDAAAVAMVLGELETMSSLTLMIRTSTPSARSFSAAAPKCSTSPA